MADLAAQSPGCLLFLVDTAVHEPNVVWVTEIWRSPAEHAASAGCSRVSDLADKIAPLLGSPAEISFTRPAATHVPHPYEFISVADIEPRPGYSPTGKRSTSGRSAPYSEPEPCSATVGREPAMAGDVRRGTSAP